MRLKLNSLILSLLFGLIVSAQSISPQVVASSGGEGSSGNASLSWTVGQIATETFSNGNVTLTQGFQQPISVAITGINLSTIVFLEGPFNGVDMNGHPELVEGWPLEQPYNISPWNYTGSESVTEIPASVVDWVLVELRESDDASSAISETMLGMQAGFLLKNGSVVGMDGISNLFFDVTLNQNLFVVIHHRNHLNIMSANALSQSGGIFTYDFSAGINQAYLQGEKLVNGKAVMFGGDMNADGNINTTDKTIFVNEVGTAGYLKSDITMDGQSDNKDKNDIWVPNNGVNSQIPN